MFTQSEILEITNTIYHHYALMISTSLGTEALSPDDIYLLESYGVNIESLKLQFPSYYQMFLLGRLTAILKEHQVHQLTPTDFKKYLDRGQFIPLSQRERAEYEVSREMTYGHLKGLADKVTSEARNKILEQNKMSLIQTTLSEGVKNRKSIQSIVSDLGHKTGEWDRDWKRIVVTEMQNIYSQGRAATMREKYGEEALCYKTVYPLACRWCIKLYLTHGIGSAPKIFKLSELEANGDNIGKKVDDWKPVVGAVHPSCRCHIREVFRGQRWNEATGTFEYSEERERRVIRTSKIKITVGDKTFFV